MSAPDLCTPARNPTVSGYYEILPICHSALAEVSIVTTRNHARSRRSRTVADHMICARLPLARRTPTGQSALVGVCPTVGDVWSAVIQRAIVGGGVGTPALATLLVTRADPGSCEGLHSVLDFDRARLGGACLVVDDHREVAVLISIGVGPRRVPIGQEAFRGE